MIIHNSSSFYRHSDSVIVQGSSSVIIQGSRLLVVRFCSLKGSLCWSIWGYLAQQKGLVFPYVPKGPTMVVVYHYLQIFSEFNGDDIFKIINRDKMVNLLRRRQKDEIEVTDVIESLCNGLLT